MVSNDEKNIFLQDLEEEHLHEEKITTSKEKKGISATALFAAFSVFFIFMIILLVFVLSLSGSGNPVFKTFGIQGFEIKNFLKSILNNSFFIIIIFLLFSTVIGVFRGYSFSQDTEEKKEKRRGSFVFGSVSGALIFISLLSWGVASAFIEKFVVEEEKMKNAIEVLNENEFIEKIVAPVDIVFSAEKTIEQLKKQGILVESIQWSKDGGIEMTQKSKKETITMKFYTDGPQEIMLILTLDNGTEKIFTRSFEIDEASFEIPSQVKIKQNVLFDATKIAKNSKKYEWDFDNDGEYEESSKNATINHIFKKSGIVTVNLRVEASVDTFDFFSRTFRVLGEDEKSMGAIITADKEFSGQAPFSVSFNGSDSFSQEGEIINYVWTIGKTKIQKKGKNISHIFEESGTFPVTLFIENQFGESAEETIEVVVTKANSAPKAFITSSPEANKKNHIEGILPLEIKFSGEKSTDSDENIIEYKWTLENSEKNSEKIEFLGSEMSYIFRKAGDFVLRLEVEDKEGAIGEMEYTLSLQEPSVLATLRLNPESGTVPLIVEFNASESSCKSEKCRVNSFLWDFGDGTPVKTDGAHNSHQFTKTGQFEVKVTALTNTGEKSIAIAYINVTEPSFKACFTSSRSQGVAPVKISFDPSLCSEGKISEYKWDFGDGIVSNSKKPSHTFESAGEYLVTLNIFDKNHQVSTATKTITIIDGEE